MRKYFWSMVLCLMASLPTYACDACGCVGAAGLSLMPHQQSSFVGLSWQSLRFRGSSTDFEDIDHFQLASLQLNWRVAERLQLLAILPYRMNATQLNDQLNRSNGLGDMSLMAQYRVFPGKNISLSPVKHVLDVGLGIKLPTGKFQDEVQANALPTNYQLGSGSLDYLARVRYHLSRGNWNFQVDVFGRLTTVNSQEYRFGDQLSVHSFVGYWHRRVGYSVMLYTGLYTEYMSQDVNRGFYQLFTGGNGQYISTGMETLLGGNYSMGVNIQPPISQNYAQGDIVAKSRFQFRFNFLF